MKTIIVISPHYLEAVFNEAKRYNFVIHGYGKFAQACKGILYVNADDLLGISFIGDMLPKVNSKDYQKFIEFLGLVSNMQKKIKFTIVTKENIPQSYYKVFRGYPEIEFYGRSGLEYITNTVIGQNVFGSIILNNEKPYIFKEVEAPKPVNYTLSSISANYLISPYILQCLDDVVTLDSIESTLQRDSIYSQYVKNKNTVLALLRRYLVGTKFGIYDSSLLEQARNELKASQGEIYVILLALIVYVGDKYGY